MRKGTIQINNYFAKLGASRVDLLPPPRSSKVFRALASTKVKNLPVGDAFEELLAAWRLGIVTATRQDGNTVTWNIDGQRLSNIAGEGMPQAAEQLAAALAVALEGLGVGVYSLDVSGPIEVAQCIDVFSATYNALLARELGVPPGLLLDEQVWVSMDMPSDDTMRTHVRDANDLIESHGIRRMHKLQRKEIQTMKEVTKESQPRAAHLESTSLLTVWRHVQDGSNYRLGWYVELSEGMPIHIACSVEYGTEVQQAVIETYTALANSRLEQAGIPAVVLLGAALQGSHFGENSPIEEFTTVFATTFLTREEQTQIGFKSGSSAEQTDLLQSIEAVMCEHCNNPVQQFGSYGICSHCGDAQIVKK